MAWVWPAVGQEADRSHGLVVVPARLLPRELGCPLGLKAGLQLQQQGLLAVGQGVLRSLPGRRHRRHGSKCARSALLSTTGQGLSSALLPVLTAAQPRVRGP